LAVLTDEDFGAVEEAFEWSRAAATQYFYQGSWRQNCKPVAVYIYHSHFLCILLGTLEIVSAITKSVSTFCHQSFFILIVFPLFSVLATCSKANLTTHQFFLSYVVHYRTVLSFELFCDHFGL